MTSRTFDSSIVRSENICLRYQISLKFVQIHVEASVETEGGRNTGDNLRDDTVQVREARRANAQVFLANLVDGLVINLHMYG